MMTIFSRLRIAVLIAAPLLAAGCASTTQSGVVGVERKQLLLVSSEQAEQGAATFYAREKDKYAKAGALNANAQQTARVKSIANGLIEQAGAFRPDTRNWKWEVSVISSKEVNAYCAAGGKMAIYTGLLDGLKLTVRASQPIPVALAGAKYNDIVPAVAVHVGGNRNVLRNTEMSRAVAGVVTLSYIPDTCCRTIYGDVDTPVAVKIAANRNVRRQAVCNARMAGVGTAIDMPDALAVSVAIDCGVRSAVTVIIG